MHKQATLLALPPPVALQISKDPTVANYDISSLQEVLIGAAPVAPSVIDDLMKKVGIKYVRQGLYFENILYLVLHNAPFPICE